ncbi:hypothetical protein G5C65_01590 [Streptomyces sp. SB3404]|uniref:Uncharacterized protein n=2 Tax=Streptomyces boncukensis TaxID=2711219 RepID=A0A6G4WPR0_9ACTN|nr:hypothetical protein [Streptomyces boncukensis]
MLIQQPRFAEARHLTETLEEDPRQWSAAALLADQGIAQDSERSAALLATWTQICLAAIGTSSLFAEADDQQEPWVRHGRQLAEAAVQGEAETEASARDCATKLDAPGRAALLAHLSTRTSRSVELAGGLEELLEQEGAHRHYAGNGDAPWVTTAAWTICALTELHEEAASARLEHLVQEAGHAADVWRTWAQVAASVLSSRALEHMEPFPHESAPVGLARRTVEAVHGTTSQQRRTQKEFAAQSQENQHALLFELGMMIAAIRAQPARRAARQAERTVGRAPRDAEQQTAYDVLQQMPDEVAERIGRMRALARRAILALIDGDRETLAAVVNRIATYDDDPGRRPYPQPRFRLASREALKLTNAYFYQAETHGSFLANTTVADGARDLITRYAPTEHQQAAGELLTVMKGGGRQSEAEFSPTAGDDAAGLLAFAAASAWLAVHPKVFRSRETARLTLIQEIRENEAKALKIPDREIVTEISDQDALAFLDQLYDENCPLPRDATERAVWERDIIAITKQHLLETPASATTPEQQENLRAQATSILRAATGTPRRTAAPPDRSGTVRKQPKRQPKRKRRGR